MALVYALPDALDVNELVLKFLSYTSNLLLDTNYAIRLQSISFIATMSSSQYSITVSWMINVICMHQFDSVCNHCNALLRSLTVLNCTLYTDRFYVMTVTIILTIYLSNLLEITCS
jgi:hypothetical protein